MCFCLFALFCFLVKWYNILCNDCAPKYRCFSNFVLTNRIENGHCCCWKITSLVLHDMSINTIRYSICLLVTVLHCWIIFNFLSIISSLVNQRTFVFISSYSIDFRLFLLLISNHILIISSKHRFVYLNKMVKKINLSKLCSIALHCEVQGIQNLGEQ